MASKVNITLQVDSDLLEAFMEELNVKDESPSSVVEGLMRHYVDDREHTRDYDEYLGKKVEAAFEDIRAGRVFSHEEITAKYAAKREERNRRK
jgi:predicted transcriptional regulator